MVFSVKLFRDDNVVIDGSFSGSLNNNCINYNDGVNNIVDLNKLLLERISDDYKIVFDFTNATCDYITDGMSVNMMIEVIDKIICSNSLFFKYKVIDTGNIYEYSVSW